MAICKDFSLKNARSMSAGLIDAKQLDDALVPDWQVPEFERAKDQFGSIFEQITEALLAHQPRHFR
ncbi:hypothetical protein H6F88_01510 [Oculatella sp. FACHB-28]|uniref:hypothetical protein n=1 Tax=Cyanophyceae TaxID=3028117 RepID=UPI00168848BD|nr:MULTISPECIES: hypothetical protein [Cyanophyceae]MBD1996655.1 hypothetical protein [Leptolyngbya sp. FACHB-541]MBD2054717.1 hypothetical protein [Oculatella sp. FACHB-28]